MNVFDNITLDDLFKGLAKSEIEHAKSLLPVDIVTVEELEYVINELPIDQQIIIDYYFDRARKIQRFRYLCKKALFHFVLTLLAGLIFVVPLIFIISK